MLRNKKLPKSGVMAGVKQAPTPPPVYHPQPVPKVLQKKSAVAPAAVYRPQPVPRVLQKKAAVAPPVYRPQPVPKVLQKKSAIVPGSHASHKQVRNAPAAYRPQPTPRVLQAKFSQTRPCTPQLGNPARSIGMTSGALQKSTGVSHGALNPRIIQRAEHLRREPFTPATLAAVKLPSGLNFHRRHIIAHHTMMDALQAWLDDQHSRGAPRRSLRLLLKEMNNNTANLVPGPGAANTAIGMFSHTASQLLEKFENKRSTPAEMRAALSEYRGFQKEKQRSLFEPALAVLTDDPFISQSHETALPYVISLLDSADFDWPEDPDPSLFDSWAEAELGFRRIKNNPQAYSYDDLKKIVTTFMNLPKPVKLAP